MVTFQYIVDNSSNKSSTVRTHYHSCYELIYYFQGNGINNFMQSNTPQLPKILVYDTHINPQKSNKFLIESGRCIIYKPYTLHNEKLTGPSEVFSIVFTVPESWEFDTCLLCDLDGSIGKYIKKIRKEYEKKDYEFNLVINTLLTQVLIQIKRKFLSTQKENPSIQQAINFLDDYYATEVDLQQLAQSIGYSTDHFRFLFKKTTGFSPKKYILQKRLEVAKNQIEKTSLSLFEIAENCGYEDYYQFSTYFKKETGLSPSMYRKNFIL